MKFTQNSFEKTKKEKHASELTAHNWPLLETTRACANLNSCRRSWTFVRDWPVRCRSPGCGGRRSPVRDRASETTEVRGSRRDEEERRHGAAGLRAWCVIRNPSGKQHETRSWGTNCTARFFFRFRYLELWKLEGSYCFYLIYLILNVSSQAESKSRQLVIW